MAKVAIIGSRTFNDYNLLKKIMNEIDESETIDIIISGGAKGADSLGEQYADEVGIEKLIFPALWEKYGRKAGPLRNTDIINNSDIVVCFWDGKSTGTLDSINKAKASKKDVHIIRF